jgi:hypothetical protein
MRLPGRFLLICGLAATALAAVVAAAIFFAPRLSALPWLESRTRMTLVSTRVGELYTLSGETPRHEDVTVRLRGRWNGGVWEDLASTTSTAGLYRLTFRIRRAGTLSLRVTYPGGEATGALLSYAGTGTGTTSPTRARRSIRSDKPAARMHSAPAETNA